MTVEYVKRKSIRLSGFDYRQDGAYFITICTQHKRCLLSRVVGDGALDVPQVELTRFGQITEKYILSGDGVGGVYVDRYVIMPNHVHMILTVEDAGNNGSSRAPTPTNQKIPHFISTLKRFCHRDMGETVFQRSYYDHVIRNETDYLEIARYVENNPAKWAEDEFYFP